MTEKIVEMAQAAGIGTQPRIRLPLKHSPLLQKVIDRVNTDDELFALWQAQNVNAVDRLGMSDHGPVHMNIVANISLRLLRLLHEREIEFTLLKNYGTLYGFTFADVEVVIVLASLFHDVGMSIHRIDHEQYSLFVAQPIITRLLDGLYSVGAATIIRSETLHAIISHRADGKPLTIEAGIVRVGDALDMSQGRSRIPFQAGHVNIHSVSAAAIDKVEISHGEDRPIRIRIVMNNSAGIFQVDELMRDKLRGSGIEHFVEVEAQVTGETEKKLVTIVKI
ncbi:MAG TPA: HD domain-containing protein [Anaerolineae bacterium]|nr:HD domain-containing protein [Anaerolineae bacterium]